MRGLLEPRDTILVTGSEGLIGTALVRALLRSGYGVRRFDLKRSWGGALQDVRSSQKLDEAVADCAGIVHLAAVSRVILGERDPDACWQTNVEGTRNVLCAASAVRARPRPWVILASSREVYGEPGCLPVTEDAPLAPMNIYGRSKAAAEQLCLEARADGLRTAVLRLSNVYGSVADHADRVVPCFAASAARGLPLRVEGGAHTFDFTHLADTVDGILRVIAVLQTGERRLPPIHLVTGRPTTLAELALMAVEAAGQRGAWGARIIESAPRPYDVTRFRGDPRRAQELLGWQAKVGLREGLAQLVEEFLRQTQSQAPATIAAAPVPTISVVIPVYNGGASFRRCLASFQSSTARPDELIVVADGDSDGAWRVAEELGARVIRLPETGGPARARNIGARAARGDILFFVDADVVVHADALGRVGAAFQDRPNLAALFGSYDDAPAESNFLSQYRNLLHHFVHQSSREQASTFWSGCGAIRREIFLSLGGFDERYRQPSIEDIELGYRLTRAGHQIRLCKDVQATHLKEWRAGSVLRTDLTQRAVPWTELILRDRLFVRDLNLRLSGRLSVILTYFALFCMVAAGWWPRLAAVGVTATLAMLALNAQLFRFFLRKRGPLFTLAAVPWVGLYQLYSGLGFVIGALRHLALRPRFG